MITLRICCGYFLFLWYCVADKERRYTRRETLEDLYYGNITPYDRQIRSSTSLMKAMEQSQECEEQLTKLLEGEAHSLLLRLINAENEIGSTLALENFILGFRLGTRLTLEALDEDDGSLVELLRRDDRREEQE